MFSLFNMELLTLETSFTQHADLWHISGLSTLRFAVLATSSQSLARPLLGPHLFAPRPEKQGLHQAFHCRSLLIAGSPHFSFGKVWDFKALLLWLWFQDWIWPGYFNELLLKELLVEREVTEDCRWAFDEKIVGGGGWLEEGMTGNPSVSRYPIAPPDTPPLCVNSNFKRLGTTERLLPAKYCLPAAAIFIPPLITNSSSSWWRGGS